MKIVTASLLFGGFVLFVGIVSFLFGWFCGDTITTNSHWKFLDAARRGDTSAMEKMYAAGAKVDGLATNEHGEIEGDTPLVTAAYYGQRDAVSWLLKHGADPNRTYDHGTNAIGAANYRRAVCEEIVVILKQHGAK